jgi:hypothetical protein
MKSLILTILLSTFAFSNISVVTSSKSKLSNITQKDLANLFLKKTNSINGVKLIPIDNQNPQLFQEFYEKVVKKTPDQLHAYWVNQMYKGDRTPPKKLSTGAIKKAMKTNTQIISYSKNPKTGHILLTIP